MLKEMIPLRPPGSGTFALVQRTLYMGYSLIATSDIKGNFIAFISEKLPPNTRNKNKFGR
jgi:hypothetical protein